jgi:hypothetical protein
MLNTNKNKNENKNGTTQYDINSIITNTVNPIIDNSIFMTTNSVNTNTNNSVFMTTNSEDISGKITYTSILETVPENRRETSLDNWKSKGKTEWRWRFLEFENRSTVEISFMKSISDQRNYFTKQGSWIIRDVPKEYDDYVVKQFFYYSNE